MIAQPKMPKIKRVRSRSHILVCVLTRHDNAAIFDALSYHDGLGFGALPFIAGKIVVFGRVEKLICCA